MWSNLENDYDLVTHLGARWIRNVGLRTDVYTTVGFERDATAGIAGSLLWSG